MVDRRVPDPGAFVNRKNDAILRIFRVCRMAAPHLCPHTLILRCEVDAIFAALARGGPFDPRAVYEEQVQELEKLADAYERQVREKMQ